MIKLERRAHLQRFQVQKELLRGEDPKAGVCRKRFSTLSDAGRPCAGQETPPRVSCPRPLSLPSLYFRPLISL